MLISYFLEWSIPSYPLGPVATALILGIFLGNILQISKKSTFTSGLRFCEKTVLEFSIILMGLKLNFSYLLKLGPKALVFVIVAIMITLIVAPIIGRFFKLNFKGALLTGVGSAVCGSSAIAAFNPVLGASAMQMALAIGIVNFLGTIGIFVLPVICEIFQFSDIQSSFLIGGTLQAVGHVAASGFSLGTKVGENAILIKMFRVLMIGPIVLIYSFYQSLKEGRGKKISMPKFPLFIIGFLLASIVTSYFGNNQITHYLLIISKILLTTAMAAIGLKISFKDLKNDGTSMLYTGTTIFIVQIIVAICLIYLLAL